MSRPTRPIPQPTQAPSSLPSSAPTSIAGRVQGSVSTIANSPFYLAITIACIVFALLLCCLCCRARSRKKEMERLRRIQAENRHQQQQPGNRRQQQQQRADEGNIAIAVAQVSVAGGPVRAPPPPDPNQMYSPQAAFGFSGSFQYFMPAGVELGAAPQYTAPDYDPPSYNFRSSNIDDDPYFNPVPPQPVSAGLQHDEAVRIEAARAQAAALELAIAEAEAQARAHEEALAVLEAKVAAENRLAPLINDRAESSVAGHVEEKELSAVSSNISNGENEQLHAGDVNEEKQEHPEDVLVVNNGRDSFGDLRSPQRYEFDDFDIVG